jgi:hypothetical protein
MAKNMSMMMNKKSIPTIMSVMDTKKLSSRSSAGGAGVGMDIA